MTDTKQLPKRGEVDQSLTWDLTTIFKNHAAFEIALKHLNGDITSYKNANHKIDKPMELQGSLSQILDLNRRFEKVFVYAQLENDSDTKNLIGQDDIARTEALGSELGQATAWFEPAVLSLGKQKVSQFSQKNSGLKQYARLFTEIFQKEGHVLPPEQEKLLAKAAPIFAVPEKTFDILDSSNLKFPTVKNREGNTVQLSDGIYSTLMQSTDRRVRKEAFKGIYSTYQQYQDTFAQTLSGNVAVNNFEAEVHHYKSARDEALSETEIPSQVYDVLIKSVREHLPLLHRYVALRKKALAVDQLHMYDMYAPLNGDAELKYNFEEAKATALKALSVLGNDYLKHVKEEFNSRWIDVVESQGKRTGGYSSGSYDTNPFILLNWQDNLDNLYTLVHETGHSMHSFYTAHNQPYQYGDYSIFVAEIASTTNENILTDYLLKNNSDPKIISYVLNSYLDGFKGTIFRQTQFAEFEDLIHKAKQNGTPLTADFLNKNYLALNKKYYGSNVFSDPEIALEWSRIPHFYYDFYVYQYATGFACASALSDLIINGSESDKKRYLDFLKSGSSKDPITTMKVAGVDMTKPDYLDRAFAKFEERLDQLEQIK